MEERCTIYFSRSTESFNESSLPILLEKWRYSNANAGISGILLYVRGSIIQVLEGEAQAVETLFERIQADRRHTDITRVMNRPIDQRFFPDWAMGYETITSRQMEDIKGMVVLDEHHNASVRIKPDEPLILRLIKVFYDSHRYD
ncbi:BLUF domain-containing protein [Spirosoma sordidisoli]|uniref:BLUF domain-containing protein n=1 Tax=Spirosoma sordidisoli TaxID=2502893 RepID=A0A4Q2UGR1_9BACT|nr:BLUF domain-containing protein [Spirosoma sordidisoli]RYC66615.1 BLUF domain-containing protein [Spirosoma sordidisoli]